MRHLIYTIFLLFSLTQPVLSQEKLRWTGLDSDTRNALLNRLSETEFDLQGMRPLSVSTGTCPSECSLYKAACACPKTAETCPPPSSPSDKGALCLAPARDLVIRLEDGRESPALSLP
jgi:hypothetical protein